MSHMSLGRPEFVPGTPPGHPTAKFLYVIFLYRFFLSILKWEILESDLGSAPEGAPGNRGALGDAPERAQRDWGVLQGVLPRVPNVGR